MSNKSNINMVSVIIPTYGRADLIGRAIDSVLNQTYNNFEVIVVNDNSIESYHFELTMNKLKPYLSNPKVKVIAEGVNSGGSGARNKGIKESKGQYVTFLDDDDYYYVHKLETHMKHIMTESIDVSVCEMDILKNGRIVKDSRSKPLVFSLQQFLIKGNCFTPMIFANKKVLENIDGFTITPRFQDHILMLKILASDYKVGIINEALFVHYDHLGERITRNKLGCFDVRWRYEDTLIACLNDQEIKWYWLRRNLYQVRVLRDNKIKGGAWILFLKSFNKVNSLKGLIEYAKVGISLML